MKSLKIFSVLYSAVSGSSNATECELATVSCDIATGFTVAINETCRALDHDHVSLSNSKTTINL